MGLSLKHRSKDIWKKVKLSLKINTLETFKGSILQLHYIPFNNKLKHLSIMVLLKL